MKLSKKALEEIRDYKLDHVPDYILAVARYRAGYDRIPPHGVPDRNMLKALRMAPWRNTADDWARLHTCEMYMSARKALKASLLRGQKLASY